MEGVYHVQLGRDWEAEWLGKAAPEKLHASLLVQIGEQFRGVSFWLGRCSDANQPEEEAA